MNLHQQGLSRVNAVKKTSVAQATIKDKEDIFIFPFQFLNNINNTNQGLKSPNAIRNRFIQWESLLPGNESIFLNWKNSTYYTQDDTYMENHWNVEFSKERADWFKGCLVGYSGSTEFDSSDFGTFGTFTNIIGDTNVKVQTTRKVTLEMLTDFYVIPSITYGDEQYDDNQIYRIVDFQNYETNGVFVYADISFQAVKNELATSGQAIEQKFYFGSPGQGYAFPKLIFNGDNKAIDFEIHNQLSLDTGVKSIQFEITGNAGIASVEVYGVPVENINEPNNKIYAPRRLLIENFKLPIQEEFFKVSNAENIFYIADMQLFGTTDFDTWQSRRKDIVGDKQMNYQGMFYTSNETANTNQQGYSISDLNLTVHDALLTKIGKNGIWNTQPASSFYDGKKDDGTDGIGVKSINLQKMGRKQFKDLINLMGFANSYINKLPYELNSKITWSTRNIFLVGGFLNGITLGYPINWRKIYTNTDTLYPGIDTVPVMLNKGMYDFFTGSTFASNLQTSTTKKIPLDVFQSSESDTLGAIFGSSATTTSVHFSLSDKMSLVKYNETTGALIGYENASSVMISQTLNGEKYKVGEESIVLPATTNVEGLTDTNGTSSYILTGIGIKAIGDGDIRVTCYKDDIDSLPNGSDYKDSIVYQTIIKSQAGYRNEQIREWLTFTKTAFVEAIVNVAKDFTWPQALPEPAPETQINQISATIPEQTFFNAFRRDDNGDVTGTSTPQTILLYDFGPDGFDNVAQIKSAFENIIFKNNIMNLYSWVTINGAPGVTGDKTNAWSGFQKTPNDIVTISIKNINEIGETAKTITFNSDFGIKTSVGSGLIAKQRTIRAYQNVTSSLYFDGVKLYLKLEQSWFTRTFNPGSSSAVRSNYAGNKVIIGGDFNITSLVSTISKSGGK